MEGFAASSLATSLNTTGVKGVYRVKGKYLAKIVFQQKQYHIGYYATFEEAVEARKEAETFIEEKVILFYEKWQKLAEKDPEWAKDNSIRFIAMRTNERYFDIECHPNLA